MSDVVRPERWRVWAPCVFVVVIAALLRVALLPTARFGGDEALFFQIGCDIVEGRAFPILGTQITDGAALLPGPTFLYLMALPLLIVKVPEAQYLFTELLGAGAVGAFYLAMRRPFGARGAFVSSLLLACAPWAALFADRTWNPNALVSLECVALLAAVRVRENPSSRWLAAFLPLCAVMPHFHMGAPVAWAGLVVVVWPTVRAWKGRVLLVGVLLSLLLYVPLTVHELATGFENTRNFIREMLAPKERHPTSFLWVPVYVVRFLSLDVTYHELTGYWGGPDELRCLHALWFGSTPRPFHPLRVLDLIASLVLVASMGIVVVTQAVRARSVGGFGGAFLLALACNLALLGLTGKQVFGHYAILLLPFAFVGYAALGRAVFDDAARGWRVVTVVLLALFCVGGFEATLSVSRHVDGRIGLQVHRQAMRAIVDDGVREHSESEPVRLDFGYFSNPYDWDIFARRALHSTVHFDRNARTRHYKLVEEDAPLPGNARPDGVVDLGFARLVRLQ